MPYLGILGLKFKKTWQYENIWNQQPRIYQSAKYCEKMKMLKFGTKNVFFGYFFGVGIWKQYCHI